MLRRLSTLLSAASLVLLLLIAVLWAASYRATVTARFQDSAGLEWQVVSERGVVWMDNSPQVEADRQTRERLAREFQSRSQELRRRLPVAEGRIRGYRMVGSGRREAERLLGTERPDSTEWAGLVPESGIAPRRGAQQAEHARVAAYAEAQAAAAAEERDAILAGIKAARDGYAANPGPNTFPSTPFAVRHGWLAGACAILPAAWLVTAAAGRIRRRVGRVANRCPACGYDLRATPGRCPECGAGSGMQ